MPRYVATISPAARVFCNEVEYLHVAQCDTDENWLEYYPVNASGDFIRDPRDPGRELPYTQVVWGTIRVEPLDPSAAHTAPLAPQLDGGTEAS